MAEMRTTPSLSTNHTNGTSTTPSSLPPDLDNLNGLTAYVNCFLLCYAKCFSTTTPFSLFFLQVETIFRQMEEKFSASSEQVMNRMNELGKRIDTLETNLGDIITQLPSEPSTSTSQPVKTTNS